MAGSSTPSMEKFTSQGVEPHQIMMNAEVMKHLRIMNGSSVREIMIQHEKTFKEQVHDLHKLYEVQKLLMDKVESRGREPSTGIQSQVQGKVITEGFNHGRAVDWEQATRNNMGLIRNDAASHNLNNSQKVSRETGIVTGGTSSDNLGRPSPTLLNRTTKLEETIKSVSSPSRKRKIDLEQLPEDSDDEMQNSGDVFKPSASNLSENSRQQSAKASSGFECLVTLEPNPQVSSKFQPLQTVNLVQVGNPFLGDSSSQNGQSSSSRGDPSYSSQDGQTMPNLSFNTMKAKKNEANPGEVLVSFQNTSILGSDIGSLKNTPTFLPQPDFLDRASQEAGKQTHSFYQASEINAVNAPARISLQQQQTSSHLGVSGNTVNRSYHPIPYSEQTPHNKSTPIDTVNNVFGKALLGMNSPTLASVGARKDAASVLAERLGETSKFFTKDSMLQAPLINAAPMTRLENASPLRGTPVAKPEIGIMAGGKNIEGVVSPAISVAINKGFGHEQDMNFWPSQSSVLKVPQFQQSALFQQTILPPTSQAMWVPSSLNLQNGMYSQQQMAYGFQVTDPSQANHAGDMIQRSQGESPGSWNAVDLGQYYTSIPSIQKPPFKKPPKLVLKNDGFGMELKLVAPEACEEKVNIKKSLNVMKRESPQASSELTNSKGHMNIESVEEDKNLSKNIGSQSLMLNTSTQNEETKMTLGTLIEPKSLAMEVSSCTYKLAPNGLNSALSLAIDRENLNTLIDCTSDSGISLNFHVSRPADESTQQFSLLHFDAGLPSSGKENPAKISSLMSSQTAIEKGIPAQMVASDVKNMQGQTEKRSLINEGLDVNVGLHIAEERKESVEKVSASEGVADLVASSQSETFHTEIQALQSERKEVNSNVEELENADINGKQLQKCEKLENHVEDVSDPKSSMIVNFTHSSVEVAVQPALVQSTGNNSPSTSMQENERLSSISDNDNTSHGASSRNHNDSGAPPSDWEGASLPLATSAVDGLGSTSNEDIEHESDSDNLAASILLSFAPKMELLNEQEQARGGASELSSSTSKVKFKEKADCMLWYTGAPSGSKSDNWNGRETQDRRLQGPSSNKKLHRADQHHHKGDHTKVSVKERRQRKEGTHQADQEIVKGDVVVKSLTVKLPRIASTSSGGMVSVSRSKHLNKLNGEIVTKSPGEPNERTHRTNEVIHMPTGRRSSRGPHTTTRTSHESRSRSQEQTQHLAECRPVSPGKDSWSKGGSQSVSRVDSNLKRKAWGELNRTRSSLSRKQFDETPHRRGQR